MFTLITYGTLCRAHRMNRLMTAVEATFKGWAAVRGYKLVDLGRFPGAVPTGNNDDVIFGEVWTVPDLGLHVIDEYEGAPHLYSRANHVHAGYISAAVGLQEGRARPLGAGLYTYNMDAVGADALPDGAWNPDEDMRRFMEIYRAAAGGRNQRAGDLMREMGL